MAGIFGSLLLRRPSWSSCISIGNDKIAGEAAVLGEAEDIELWSNTIEGGPTDLSEVAGDDMEVAVCTDGG